MQHLLDFSLRELEQKFLQVCGEGYRVQQVCEWVFQRGTKSFEKMTNIPGPVRARIAEVYALQRLAILQAHPSKLDETVKYTFKTSLGDLFSAVFLPHGKYNSLCISSQVGCAWKCSFCASGLVPFKRNLTSGEILDQIFLVEQATGKKIYNILFMGMGEPLANYAGTVKTIEWLVSAQGFRMNPGRITLSTTGLPPQIKKLAEEGLKVNLALSLHAPSDALRKKIMPVSSKFPLEKVLEAVKFYQNKTGAELTLEYILLKDVNDQLKHAEQLHKIVAGFHFDPLPKINLIPYNPVPGLAYHTSDPRHAQSFFEFLKRHKFNVHTRKPQGQDIEAACGQLL